MCVVGREYNSPQPRTIPPIPIQPDSMWCKNNSNFTRKPQGTHCFRQVYLTHDFAMVVYLVTPVHVIAVHTVAARARLCSADQGDVISPASRTTRFGQRSFCSSASTAWNDQPSELKKNIDICRQCFKLGLKTWLYDRAYS